MCSPAAPVAIEAKYSKHSAPETISTDPALWRVYDDVPAMLKRWSVAGIRLAVVSNFDSRLPGLLEALGLARWLPGALGYVVPNLAVLGAAALLGSAAAALPGGFGPRLEDAARRVHFGFGRGVDAVGQFDL